MLSLHEKNMLQINFQVDIEASPEQVWAILASKEGMSQWFSRNLIFEFEEGGEFRMEVTMDEGHWIFYGEVRRIIPNEELAFTWTQQEVGGEAWPVSTLVRFQLTKIEGGTRVDLVHSGFEALDKAIAQGEYEDHIQGWQASAPLDDLKKVVEASL